MAKNKYSVETLRELNVSYDHEHGLTQEDVDMLIDYFSSVTRLSRYDQSINDIINEETALFFDGTKSVDETAFIIQSRASIYMSEQY